MKKIISLALSLCLMISLLSVSLGASADATPNADTIQQTIRALGIIVGDENGNMNLASHVTRAEFAKMMVAASTYKDSVGGSSGNSLFRDVKQGYWAVEYIKLAVNNGWFYGYPDGTFCPDNNITLEEGAAAILRILGYTPTDLTGAYPDAQLSKFNALGLNEFLTKRQGELLTRYDCMIIFYNLMTTANKSGTIYGKSLGYTINSAGELDYSSIVSVNMKGPYVLASGASLSALLPYSTSNSSVYIDGTLADISSAAAYDVYYYNANLRSVWLYDNRVVGTYTAASPSRLAPTSVTVAGNSYKLATSGATYKMSSMGSFNIGDTVTLLLGADGSVVDVVAPGTTNQGSNSPTITYYGIVISAANASYTDSTGNTVTANNIKVACTDGVTRQYASSITSTGILVSITLSGSDISISTVTPKSLSGTISKDGTGFGGMLLSSNVQILDTNSSGAFAVIYPARIAGCTLSSSNVLYYDTDSSGKIDALILNDVTGDIYSYGVLTNVLAPTGYSTRSSYSYIINGTAGTLSSTTKFTLSGNAALFHYNSAGTIDLIRNLTSTNVDSISSLYATYGDQKYRIADGVQSYIYNNSTYSLSNIATVSDTSKYTLTGYYDELGYSAGGRIRVIIATPITNS